MPQNELVLLDQLLTERQEGRLVALPDDQAFELFACEQAVRDLDLSADEVEAGIVGGGNDGGIDGIYVFLGDALLAEDSEVLADDFPPSGVPTGTPLTIWFVQAKRGESFSETTLDLATSSLNRLLDLQVSPEELKKLYSDEVVERVMLFRETWQKLATRHPQLQVRFVYASRGDTGAVNVKVDIKAKELGQRFEQLLPDCDQQVSLVGAAEMWKLASTPPSYTLELSYQENATAGTSHTALVKLRDYYDFLTDDSGALRRHIFDWNVRDYQGNVEVNREIRQSLVDEDAPEFWWLNNGVTIVCSRTSIVGKTYVLDDVQIVNGLQTSYAIHRVLASANSEAAAWDRDRKRHV